MNENGLHKHFFSGRDQPSSMNDYDAVQDSACIVSDAETAVATDSVLSPEAVATPLRTVSCTSVSGVQSPNVFTGYPVLTLPLGSGSPHGRSSPARLPRTPSPRKLHSSTSPSRRQLSASKTPLPGQRFIDQIFPTIPSQAVSMHQAASMSDSSLRVCGESPSLKFKSCSVSLGRKWTHPDEISVPPLLSRNRDHFTTMSPQKDVQNSDVSSVGLNCNSSVMQREENCSLDTVTSAEAHPVRQSVFADAVVETFAVKNTPVTAAEAEPKKFTVASSVTSTGCSNDMVPQKPADEKTAINRTALKIPAVKLQRLHKVLEKSMLARAKTVKTCLSNEMPSEASVFSSPSVTSTVSTEVNNVITNCEPVSASAHATSTESMPSLSFFI